VIPALLLALAAAPRGQETAPAGTVRILAPASGSYVSGRTVIEAEVAAADLVRVEFLVDGQVVAGLVRPPWRVVHDFGPDYEAHLVQVTAVLGDGTRRTAEVSTQRLVIHETAGIDLVNVFATVQDRRGRYAMSLEKDDFMILEDGRLQQISYFSRDRLPLAVEIVIDSSLSMEGRSLAEAQEAAIGFLQALEDGDSIGVMAFSEEVREFHPLGSDREAAREAIGRIRAGGGTALYDAVAAAAGRLSRVEDDRRRALILLSDGRDEAASGLTPGSLLTFEEALSEVIQSNVILYAIGLGRDLDKAMDFYHRRSLAEVLETLALESGGRAFLTARAEKLRGAYDDVEAELRHHYTLSYTSSNRRKDGTWRRIEVRVRREGYTPHARRGYYAPYEGPGR
jgi:Ca-activated chloride channel family protein